MRRGILLIVIIISSSCNTNRIERFKESVVKLREVGLFSDLKDLSDDQLTDSLIFIAKKKHATFGNFNEVYDPIENKEWFDLHVAALDDKRVWWHDLERGVGVENLIYSQTIKEFEKLSGGYLKLKILKRSGNLILVI